MALTEQKHEVKKLKVLEGSLVTLLKKNLHKALSSPHMLDASKDISTLSESSICSTVSSTSVTKDDSKEVEDSPQLIFGVNEEESQLLPS